MNAIPLTADVAPPPAVPIPQLALSLAGLTAASFVLFPTVDPSSPAALLVPVLPVAVVQTAALTAPALWVALPTLGLSLSGGDALAAVATGAHRAGRLAWGLVPALGFATLTADVSEGLWLFLVLSTSLFGLNAGEQALRTAAVAAEPEPVPFFKKTRARALSYAWWVLAVAIGAITSLQGFAAYERAAWGGW